MKKTLLFLALAALMTTGCSKTWSGIKQDTHEVVTDTKEAIHEATAPDMTVVESVPEASSSALPVVTPPTEPAEVITPVTE